MVNFHRTIGDTTIQMKKLPKTTTAERTIPERIEMMVEYSSVSDQLKLRKKHYDWLLFEKRRGKIALLGCLYWIMSKL